MATALSPAPDAATGLPQPYLLFLGDTTEPGFAKTAFGLRDWAAEACVGEYRLPAATVTTGLPLLTPREAAEKGARSLLIGVANQGGMIPDSWIGALVEAVAAGLDIVSGMHARLADIPAVAAAAKAHGRLLIDVRTPPAALPIASGRKRSGRRVLTVGTDCALGKKYTALAITAALHARGVAATFRATGQTGIMIAGAGIPMDAVVADFAAGAAEMLSPDAAPDHWDVIEGQGSLLHPAYAGVSLALLHGSQPDAVILCHDPARGTVLGAPGYAVPGVEETIAATLMLGRRTNPGIRCIGLSYNTSGLDAAAAAAVMARDADRYGLPVGDPIRGGVGFDALVAALVA